MTEKLPSPGKGRFWHGVHNPKNAKFPMVLELREKTTENGAHLPKFSRLIAQQPVIADIKALREAAEEILVRASKVDEYTGLLTEITEEA